MEKDKPQEKEIIFSELEEFFRGNASFYKVEMVFLYGSWAGGFPHPDSDIDLALLFSSKITTEEEKFILITEIAYKLVKKLNQEVNIISIYEDFRHPMLYYNAIVLGRPIFIKNYANFLNLRMQALYQMEDFSIFGIPWQLEIAQKNLKGGK
jgi:predicted nucleotidyltransferase